MAVDDKNKKSSDEESKKSEKSGNSKIEEKDFVTIEYTGTLEDGEVFDTTDEEVAEENELDSEEEFKPITICVGEGHLIEGLEEALIGRKVGGQFETTISPEKAFGKKSGDNLKLVPEKFFNEKDIEPFVGLEVNIDNQFGVVRSVAGGRIMVDFNHPLASKEVTYDVKIEEKVEDDKSKAESLLEMNKIPFKEISVEDEEAVVSMERMIPPQMLEPINNQIVDLTGFEKVSFETGEKKEGESSQESVSSEEKG